MMALPMTNYQCYHVEFLCLCHECRFWERDFNDGNCVLRTDHVRSEGEIAAVMGVRRQYVDQVFHRGMKKLCERLVAMHKKQE